MRTSILPFCGITLKTSASSARPRAFGMWVFLLTEIMFFGGMFCAYLIFRNWYHPAFVAGSNTLDITLGTTNTAVLIGSSFTMAMAVYSAEMRRKGHLILFLVLTIVLGGVFLGIKADEWHSRVRGASHSGNEFLDPGFCSSHEPQGSCTRARHGGENPNLFFPLFFNDGNACAAYGHRSLDPLFLVVRAAEVRTPMAM